MFLEKFLAQVDLGLGSDGITYQSPPVIYASNVKYIERVTSFVQASNCRCNLIVKTIVTNKELKSRKNELNRLNQRNKKRKKNKI